MADAPHQIVQGGHLVTIKVNGVEVGLARSANAPQDYGTEGVYALHHVGPAEHVPLRWSGEITLEEFVIHRERLASATQLMELAPMGPDNVLTAGLLDFEIHDDDEHDIIMVMKSCTIASYSYNVTANQISGQNARFLALDCVSSQQFKGAAGGGIGNPAA